MLLPEHKFMVEKISAELTTRNEKKYRDLILKKSAPTDEFGDPIGKDDVLKVSIWEKAFPLLNGIKPGDRVLAQLYMNCQEGIDQNSKIYHSVNFSLKQIKVFTPEGK